MDIFDNWVLMALLTPTLWAIGCLIDSCLIASKIYKSPWDGAIVSSLFCLTPVVFIAGLNLPFSIQTIPPIPGDHSFPGTAAMAGFAYAAHLLFYFRTLYCLNDVSSAETFLALSVLVVPLFAWLLLDELLPAHFYLAFAIATVGVFLQCLPVIRKVGLPIALNMVGGVVTVSLSMVLQSRSLEIHGYATSTVVFNLACFTVAVIPVLVNKALRTRIITLFRNFPTVLICCELLGLLAILSSHRATQQGPSVSLVALIESLLPAIIIAISFAVISLDRIVRVLPTAHCTTLKFQIQSMPSKMAALSLLVISLFSLSL